MVGGFGDTKRFGIGRECSDFHLYKDHANVYIVTTTIDGWIGSKHCPKIKCDLAHIFIRWLVINLGYFKFLEAFFKVFFDAHGCNSLEAFARGKS